MKVRSVLLSLGIHTTLKGFHYLLYALELCMQNEEYLLLVYKWLCLDVATHFHTKPNNVEHCIRTAIAHCWSKGNRRLLMQIAGYHMEKPPSTGEFIDILYSHFRSQEEKGA